MPQLTVAEQDHLIFYVANCHSSTTPPTIIHWYSGRVNDSEDFTFDMEDFQTLLDFNVDCAQAVGIIAIDVDRKALIVREQAYVRVNSTLDGRPPDFPGLQEAGHSVEEEFSLDHELPEKLYETLQSILNPSVPTRRHWPRASSRPDGGKSLGKSA